MSVLSYSHIHSEPTQKVGSVVKTHGYKGFLKLFFDDSDWEDLAFDQDFLYIVREGRWVPYAIEEINANLCAVKLKDFNSDKEVFCLLQCDLVLPLSILESLPENASILGYTLLDQNNIAIGTISEIIEMPGHTLLQIESEKGQYLIPFHDSLLIAIHEEQKMLQLEIVEGLLDM